MKKNRDNQYSCLIILNSLLEILMSQRFQIRMTSTMGRGIFALQDIPPHSKLFNLNEHSYITYGMMAEHCFFGLLTELQEVIDKKAHFAFYMAFVEKYRKRQKIHSRPMAHYISKLPPQLHSLILWTQTELLALKNQKLADQAKHKRQDLQEKFLKIQKFLVNNKDHIFIPNYQCDTFQQFQQEPYSQQFNFECKNRDNEGVMNSTSESDDLNEDHQADSDASQHEGLEFNQYKGLCQNIQFKRFLHFYCAIESRNIYHLSSWDLKSEFGALISVLELFNHSPKGQIVKQSYYLQAITNIKKGEQIFINYGQYNNDELLYTYGCVIDDFFEQGKDNYVEDWVENGSWGQNNSEVSEQEINNQRLSLAHRYNNLYEKEIS